MAAPPELAWGALSPSSEAAFEFAVGCFVPPSEPTKTSAAPGPPKVTSRSLLVGILLSHEGTELDDPAGELLAYFSISRQRLDEELRKVWVEQESRFDPSEHRRVRLSDFPPLSVSVEETLRIAADMWMRLGPGGGELPLRYLFGGVLAVPRSGAFQTLDLLIGDGRLSTVAGAYPDFLARGPNARLTELLQAVTPRGDDDDGGGPTDDTAAGQPRRPRLYSVGSSSDVIGVTNDVLGRRDLAEHIAHWLAAKNLQTPLAVGLFGVWGSGKSFFMRQVQSRIRELTLASAGSTQRDRESAFCANIAQVEFNAWFHSDSELWPSLATQVFRTVGGGDSEQAQVRAAATALDDLAKADPESVRLRGRVEKADAEEENARKEADALASQIPGLRDKRMEQAKSFGGSAEQAVAAGGQVTDALHGIRRLAAGWSKIKRGTRAIVVGLLVLGLSLTVLSLVWDKAGAWIAGVIAAIGSVAGTTAKALESTKGVIDADQELQDAEKRRQAAQERELTARREKAEAAEALRRRAIGPLVYASAQAERWQEQERRGVVAEIRRAFEGLSALIEDGKAPKSSKEEGSDEASGPPLERVIVYIDDLDRCDSDVVVRVLETIKLLMDLQNFVVIVGVDSRWLSRAIETRFGPMLDGDREEDERGRIGEWESMPQDYLEKIFQFSLVMPKMSPEGFGKLVGSLLDVPPTPPQSVERRVETSEHGVTGPGSVDVDRDGDGEGDLPGPTRGGDGVATAPVADTGQEVAGGKEDIDLQPTDLVITDDEKELMKELGPFIETPRSAKRLTNVYRLFRVIEGEDRLLADKGYEPVLLLLALLIGFPRQSGDLLRAVLDQDGKQAWVEFTARLRPEPGEANDSYRNVAASRIPPHEVATWTRMVEGLAAIQQRIPPTTTLDRFQAWVPSVACYTFHPWQEMPYHLS